MIRIDSIPIYVMHCKSLADRRRNLEGFLSSMGLTATWITDFDAADLNMATIREYHIRDDSKWAEKIGWQGGYAPRSLLPTEISLTVKHIVAYQKIVDSDCDYALIMEDDVLFVDGFKPKFDNLFACSGDFNFAFIGSGCNLRLSGEGLIRKDNPATKCTDSYVISRSTAKTLLSTMLPFHLPTDFELNYQIMIHNMVALWAEPPLVFQGSQNGTYKNSIR